MNNEYKLYQSLCRLGAIQADTPQLEIIKSLQEKGLELISDSGQYSLKDEVIILSEADIRAAINSDINHLIEQLQVIYETDSTNKYITNNPVNNFFSVVVSEYQSQGQGRRENKWCSPLGCNLYFSIQFQLEDLNNSSFIPLLVARSMCRALNQIGIDECKIKWPNDIYINHDKVAGILTESRFSHTQGLILVVGIGINVNMTFAKGIDKLWTSLKKHTDISYNRNRVLGFLLNHIINDFSHISDFKIKDFKHDWDSLNYLKDKYVVVSDEQSQYKALVSGLADDGALIVKYNNTYHNIYSGNVSLKA